MGAVCRYGEQATSRGGQDWRTHVLLPPGKPVVSNGNGLKMTKRGRGWQGPGARRPRGAGHCSAPGPREAAGPRSRVLEAWCGGVDFRVGRREPGGTASRRPGARHRCTHCTNTTTLCPVSCSSIRRFFPADVFITTAAHRRQSA